MSSVSFAGSLSVSAVAGLARAGEDMSAAAGEVARGTRRELERAGATGSAADTVTVSDAAGGGLEGALADVQVAAYRHLASQAVVRAADETAETALDALIRSGSGS